MKLKLQLIILTLVISITGINAQNNSEEKYRRSSLSLILLDSNTSTDEILEISTLKECENILMSELKKRNLGNIEQLRQEIDNILWAKESDLNVSTVKKIAKNSWNNYPFPDKYDNHEIKTKGINLIDELVKLSKKDEKEIQKIETKIDQLTQGKKSPIKKLEAGRLKAIIKIAKKDKTPKKYAEDLKKIDKKYGNELKTYRLQVEEFKDQIADIKVGGVRSTIFTAMRDQKKDTKIIQPKIEKQLKEQRIAQQLVRKWFSSEDGKMFDMSTIQKRGLYDANMLDFNVAKSNVRGMAILADAGEELINNTFVAIIDLDFFSNKPIADRLRAAGKATAQAAGNAGLFGSLIGATAQLSTNIAAAAIEDGYTVFSKTFLYKLKWNDEIAAEFYNIWGDENAFDKMDFQMELIGVQYEKNVINAGIFSKKGNREMETVVKKLVTRNLDDNFANLQKEYDVFKTKVPIKSINPITADVGMKEGLEGGEKFEILEMTQNPETGRTKWNRVGTATVDKKSVWDNRYNAGEEPESIIIGVDGNPITATTFKSANNAQVGMFLRQVK